MKKFISKLWIAVITFVMLLTMTIWAGTADIQFGDPTTTRGKSFDLVIKVKSKDVKLQKADLTIHYDPEKLEFVSGTNSEGGSGMVRINGKGQGSGSTTLEYRLKFNALAAGQTIVTLQTYEVTDRNDNPVNIEHKGQSKVTVKSASTTSKNANLKTLEVQPGELGQVFDATIQDYTLEVNSDVDKVIISAYPEEKDATVVVTGNEELKNGENKVEIVVTAPNGTSSKTYMIRVNKLETGITPGGQSVIDGQRITSEKYYVTYMDFPDNAQVFDGYVETTAYIFNNELTVWVEKNNNDPQYCIFYGMDQNGDSGYYRYDKYKYTVQRNFQDPGADSLRRQAQNEEEAVNNYNALKDKYNMLLIASICVAGLALLLIVILIIVLIKKNGEKNNRRVDFKKNDDYGDDADDEDDDDDDFFKDKNDKLKRTKPDKPVERKFSISDDDDDDDDIIIDNKYNKDDDEYIQDFGSVKEDIKDSLQDSDEDENFEIEDLD